MKINVPYPSALGGMAARLKQHGGFPQQDRMIKDKRRSLDKAVLYSQQGAKVQKLDSDVVARALVNPNKLTMDYDNKILSVGYEYDYKPGDIFKWLNTDTYWIVYLQDLTELAYFRGDIRKCRYTISWKSENGEVVTTQAAVRGPVETKINFIQKSGISVDEPNHSLNIILPKNPETLRYFKRYNKFYLRTLEDNEADICWRVEGFDTISTPGIIELTAVEYYSNEMEDDLENGIAGGLIVDPIPPEPASDLIVGENFIKPKLTYVYTYEGSEEGQWELISDNKTIQKAIDGKTIKVKWQQSYSGQFTLKYGSAERVIVVDSL